MTESELRNYLQANTLLYGIIRADKVPYGIYIKAYAKRETKAPQSYLDGAKSVIVLAVQTTYAEDVFCASFLTNSYRGYIGIYDVSDRVQKFLCSHEVNAVVAHDLDQKSCAIEAGLGWRGRNTLVINKQYGSHLRFDTIVTDYEFEQYDSPIANECVGCNQCQANCPYGCFESGQLDRDKCFQFYLPRRRKHIFKPVPMCNLCQMKCPYN